MTHTIRNTNNQPRNVTFWRASRCAQHRRGTPPVQQLETTTHVLMAEDNPMFDEARLAIAGWLAGYRGSTRIGHTTEMKLWLRWLEKDGIQLLAARRWHLERYAEHLEEELGRKRSTVAHKMSVICGFYKWCALEGVLEKDPVAHVRRPKVEYITTRNYLDRMELSRFLQFAAMGSTRDHALCMLLALNGLRINEALSANIEDLHDIREHHLLHIVGKGKKEADVPLSTATRRALIRYIDGRSTGPIFLAATGGRMNRHAAGRIVKRIAKAAGIPQNISPHSMRHSFITAALDAGVPLRDVQRDARHADPRTTAYYDHGRKSMDGHSTFIVSAFVAGS